MSDITPDIESPQQSESLQPQITEQQQQEQQSTSDTTSSSHDESKPESRPHSSPQPPPQASPTHRTTQQRGLIGGGGGSGVKKGGVPIHKSSRISRKAQLPSLSHKRKSDPQHDINHLLHELHQHGANKGHAAVMGVNEKGDELDVNHQDMFMKDEDDGGKSGSPPSVTTPSDMSHKQQLCIDILVQGHVNSYVDFFYLTHRVEEEGIKGGAPERTPIPDDKLSSIMSDLTGAEKAHRRGDSTLVFNSYQSLAKFFHESGDYKTAVYFYEKCLEIAESTGDIEQQCNSQENLGITHDAMGDIQAAIRFHERHLALASTLPNADTRLTSANHQLVEAYRRHAEEYERNEQWSQAVECYKKCLQCAQDGNDLHAEGIATYRLGVACLAMNDRTQSIDFQQRYLNICKRTGDQIGEGAACAALAHSFRELGDTKLAVSYLEKYHQIATKNKQQVAQAEACAALGAIYSAQGDHNTAVNYFEKTFEIARAVGDRKLVDSARINLGMARGNMALNNYFGVVKDNLPALLNWKTRRVAFKF